MQDLKVSAFRPVVQLKWALTLLLKTSNFRASVLVRKGRVYNLHTESCDNTQSNALFATRLCTPLSSKGAGAHHCMHRAATLADVLDIEGDELEMLQYAFFLVVSGGSFRCNLCCQFPEGDREASKMFEGRLFPTLCGQAAMTAWIFVTPDSSHFCKGPFPTVSRNPKVSHNPDAGFAPLK